MFKQILLSSFENMDIGMYYRLGWEGMKDFEEHIKTPHFHAVSKNQVHAVTIDIKNCCVASFNSYKTFPENKLKIILEWCGQHRQELLDNWERAKENLPLIPIPPPDIERENT